MTNTVFLNYGKVDFDNRLDFSPIMKITNLTRYEERSVPEILERVKGREIVITKELSLGKELIYQFPDSVKLICEAGTGYNNIDTTAAGERGITVCNIPGYSTEAVAQLVITFVLSLSSSMTRQQVMLKQKNFANFTRRLEVPHFEVLGKTLGIIGAGAIGRQVIKIAQALGMNILIHSRTPRPITNVEIVSLEELLVRSDFISIHCPLTPSTKYLIDEDKLKLMKPSAFIINTSRGQIVKETDLISALQRGELAGAALDVQDPEPPALDNPLFNMENVILTPHIGWKCIESRQRLIGLLADNIENFIGGTPINVVN